MWELDYKESWAPKNWCFWTVVLERLLRVPWTARRSNQSILKEISPGCSLEGLMLKLKLQYFGHLMRRADSFEKTLMLGEGDDRELDGWMASPTQWTWVWVNSGSCLSKLREAWRTAVHGVTESDITEQPKKPKNTGVGILSLHQEIFLTQELNQGLLPCWQILYQLNY